MAKTNVTFTNFAAKKLLGKTQVRPSLSDAEEAFPSNVSVPGAGVFAESIPREPGTEFFTLYSASAGAPPTVERVYFDMVPISDGFYDAGLEDAAEGGDSAQGNANHAYYLKLPSNYETTSSNPNTGSGNFVNDKRLYLSRGGLQLVPPFTTDAGLPGSSGNNRYFIELYTGDPTNPANKISSTDAIDWQFDYYSGIVFIQDSASAEPVTASAYLYVGKYLDEKLTVLSASIESGGGGGGSGVVTAVNNKAADRLVTIASTTTQLDGEANLTFDGSQLTIIGDLSASINISASAYFGDGSKLENISAGISYSRRAVNNTITASVNDTILGVSGTAAIEIRLPNAGNYSAGQYFTVKDESGAADLKNITILTTGAETIDGKESITLESPHAAVNIYSDGSSKFFIY